MHFTRNQQVTIAIIPKFSALASILGSLSIIHEILVLDRRKLNRVYHRLLLVMSVYDVIESSWNFQSSWRIPEGTENVAFALGNTAWCTAQGFVFSLAWRFPFSTFVCRFTTFSSSNTLGKRRTSASGPSHGSTQ